MNRTAFARELLALARELMGMDFPTQEALDKYLKDHPDADRSKHRVVKNPDSSSGQIPFKSPAGDKSVDDRETYNQMVRSRKPADMSQESLNKFMKNNPDKGEQKIDKSKLLSPEALARKMKRVEREIEKEKRK